MIQNLKWKRKRDGEMETDPIFTDPIQKNKMKTNFKRIL